MERRQAQRLPVQFSVAFSGELVDGEGVALNLSTSGCAVHSNNRITDRAYLHLILYPPQHDLPMKVELAKVRWARGPSFGLEFIRVNPEQQESLRRYIKALGMIPSR